MALNQNFTPIFIPNFTIQEIPNHISQQVIKLSMQLGLSRIIFLIMLRPQYTFTTIP